MDHYLNHLDRSLKKYWNEPILANYGGRSYCFKDVADRIEKIHCLFKAVGLEPGENVIICGKNSAQWAIGFLSIVTYKAVAVPLLNDFTPESRQNLTIHSDATFVMTDRPIWDAMDKNALPLVKGVVELEEFALVYDRDNEISLDISKASQMFEEKYPEGVNVRNVDYRSDDQNSIAIINYTSGTTSSPKGVILSSRALSANIGFGLTAFPATCEDNFVSMLPLAHMYGLTYELLFQVVSGVTVYFLGKTPTPTILLGALRDASPYMIITVPLVVEKIFKGKVMPMIETAKMKFLLSVPILKGVIKKKIRDGVMSAFGGKLKELIIGGAAINPEVEAVMRMLKIPYTIGYGMTECAPLIGYCRAENFVPTSCGRTITGVDIRVDSDNPQQTPGELQVRGDIVMNGYYKNEEATKGAFTEDGWLHTGDLGVVDADGNIYIKGRSKTMILGANGQNIYPEEIENILNNLPYVAESLIVKREQRLVGLVVIDADKVKSDALSEKDVEIIMNDNLKELNQRMPSYSKIACFEIQKQPFEKTPKRSIRRFLYS